MNPDENNVIMYSTGCPRCMVLKKKLNAKNVAYTEVNDVEEMQAMGIIQVPILYVNGEYKDFVEANEWINKLN